MPYKQGKKWRASLKYQGERYTKLLESKKAALQWEREELERLTASPKGMKTGTDFLKLVHSYLEFSEDFSVKTFKEKTALAQKLIRAWGAEVLVKDITPEMALDYLKIQKKERSANAANKDRKNMSAMFEWGQGLYGLQDIPINPVKCIKKFKHETAPQETYTEDEIVKLLLALDRFDTVLFRAYLETAARKNELLTLTWEDINIEKQSIQLWTRKTRDGSKQSAWLPISDALAKELKWLFSTRKNKKCVYVFPNPKTEKPYVDRRRWFKRICDRAGVRIIGFHAIRRYVASILNDKHKVSLKAVQELLRHRKEATTERYLHMVHSDLADYAGVAVPNAGIKNWE